MKKLVLLTLVLAMVLTMVGCGCKHQWEDATCTAPKTCSLCGETEGDVLEHTPGQMELASVDTDALTVTYQQVCTGCGMVLDTQEGTTGLAPVDGKFVLSPNEWNACLTSNINAMGASQTYLPCISENEDDAIVHGIVTLSGITAAMSYYDADGNVLTTGQADDRNLIYNLCMECQFTNETAKEFYVLLMLVAMTNNSELDFNAANNLVDKIFGGEVVTDNGYTYGMTIVSMLEQTVRVDIIAE